MNPRPSPQDFGPAKPLPEKQKEKRVLADLRRVRHVVATLLGEIDDVGKLAKEDLLKAEEVYIWLDKWGMDQDFSYVPAWSWLRDLASARREGMRT